MGNRRDGRSARLRRYRRKQTRWCCSTGSGLNPIDGGSISWSNRFPWPASGRIEIIRRARGTVAVRRPGPGGGVINIVTDESGRAPPASVRKPSGGSYGLSRRRRDRVAGSADGTTFKHHRPLRGHGRLAAANKAGQNQAGRASAARVGHQTAGGEIYSDFAAYKDSNGPARFAVEQ